MKFEVSPLTCGRCVRSITEALHRLDPEALVQVDITAGTVDAEGAFDAATVIGQLEKIGYRAAAMTQETATMSQSACCGTCHS